MVVQEFCILDENGERYLIVSQYENGNYKVIRSKHKPCDVALTRDRFFMLADSHTIPSEAGVALRKFLNQENHRKRNRFSMVPLE